jgi:hypothetical protein
MPLPKKNVVFTFDVVLIAQASRPSVKTTPTLAAGDVKVCGANGTSDLSSLANITTLPSETPSGSGVVKVSLSSSEMNFDRVVIRFIDAAGSEWDDLVVEILTSANTIEDSIADTEDIQSRIPAALVSGRIDASVGAMATGVITSTAIASGAITATGIATDAITAAKIASSAITSAKIAADAITATAIAANAITAAKIATDAIGAAQLASDAVAEIQSGLSTLTTANVADAVWNAATASYGTAGSYGALVETNLDAAVTTRPTATEIADAVLSRSVTSVESTAGEHTLCTVVLGILESSVSGTTWTIRKTGGSTHAAKTVPGRKHNSKHYKPFKPNI